jgi:hypothetical protein
MSLLGFFSCCRRRFSGWWWSWCFLLLLFFFAAKIFETIIFSMLKFKSYYSSSEDMIKRSQTKKVNLN